jgi:hypothetical protein
VCGRICERADHVEQFDDRAGPAVRHDQRQCVLALRPDVDEVDVDSVDLGYELRQGVEPRLDLAPVIVAGPVARELLNRVQLHALRPILDEFVVWPARLAKAIAQRLEIRFGGLDRARPDASGIRPYFFRHRHVRPKPCLSK